MISKSTLSLIATGTACSALAGYMLAKATFNQATTELLQTPKPIQQTIKPEMTPQ